MFKKLRFKFLALNMTIIIIFMIVTFGIIYLITANGIDTKNKTQINSYFSPVMANYSQREMPAVD